MSLKISSLKNHKMTRFFTKDFCITKPSLLFHPTMEITIDINVAIVEEKTYIVSVSYVHDRDVISYCYCCKDAFSTRRSGS